MKKQDAQIANLKDTHSNSPRRLEHEIHSLKYNSEQLQNQVNQLVQEKQFLLNQMHNLGLQGVEPIYHSPKK